MLFNETVYLIQLFDDEIISCDEEFIDAGNLPKDWAYAIWWDLWTKESYCRPSEDINPFDPMCVPNNWTYG